MVRFLTDDGRQWAMYHEQDCCEDVYLADVCGYPDALIGRPIITAEERTSEGRKDWGTQTWKGDYPPHGDSDESYTWTFYELATIKGSVTLRWYGSSNGCYGESVQVVEMRQEQGQDLNWNQINKT